MSATATRLPTTVTVGSIAATLPWRRAGSQISDPNATVPPASRLKVRTAEKMFSDMIGSF